MAIAYESNTDLAFDTGILKKSAREYEKVAEDLRTMASELDALLSTLKAEGWTTPASATFYEMMKTNWKDNIEKYAALLETLKNILTNAAKEYDDLMEDYVRVTKVEM